MCILGIWLRPRSQGAEASAVVYYGALDWEIALKLPIVIVPLLPIAPSLLHVSTEKKILVSDLLSENTHAAIVYHDTRRLPIMS